MGLASLFGARLGPSFHVGERVRVRPLGEILESLDERGCLDGLPFMPEMSKHCGGEFRIYKSAHKTCDTIDYVGGRRMHDAVHLTGLRCDGEFHGGCQANCLLFWKTAWLERVDEKGRSSSSKPGRSREQPESRCSDQVLATSTIIAELELQGSPKGPRYSCQATEMNSATTVLPWWDFRQYVLDVWTGNIRMYEIARAFLFWLFLKVRRIRGYRFWMWVYRTIQETTGGIPFPFLAGRCQRTPRQTLNLQPGELVQVKSFTEILQTLNARNRNRGLAFDEEMVGYCGGAHTVQRRVSRIIDEKTGRMLTLANECVVLDSAVCLGRFKTARLFCPRSVDLYWREIWLRRIDETTAATAISPYQRDERARPR